MTNDANRDPLTGAPGAHPVGAGVGAAAGGATGAAIGSVVGPLGTALGAVIGAVAGGLAGKATAEAIDPTVEDAYWRDRYVSEPYYRDGYTYDDLRAGLRRGHGQHAGGEVPRSPVRRVRGRLGARLGHLPR